MLKAIDKCIVVNNCGIPQNEQARWQKMGMLLVQTFVKQYLEHEKKRQLDEMDEWARKINKE